MFWIGLAIGWGLGILTFLVWERLTGGPWW